MSDQQIDDYVNNFILYDFPQNIKPTQLRKTLSFYTQHNIDTYDTNTVNPLDPLYNFVNQYTSISAPIYVAGMNVFFSQSREQFYAIFPITTSIRQIALGNGITMVYVGTLTDKPALENNVVIQTIDIFDNDEVLIDVPDVDPVTGYYLRTGSLVLQNDATVNCGTIDYVTGNYVINFPTAPGLKKVINSQVYPYQAAKPQACLFYDNQFIFRPVPDQAYKVELDVYVRPSVLLAGPDVTPISQWWQYIAYGASKKVFEDRMDMDSLQLIMPEYKNQERLVLRATLMDLANERTATIYTEQTSMGTMSGGGSNWGGF